MIVFRHCDSRFPFLWESTVQPPARWHAEHEGPVQYFADTPDGAWAEFLRHEEITGPEDLVGIERAIWAVDLEPMPRRDPALALSILTGDKGTYTACQAEGRRLRGEGELGLRAPSAALLPGGARGWVVDEGLHEGSPRDGNVFVIFGRPVHSIGWMVTDAGRPPVYLLDRVRHSLD